MPTGISTGNPMLRKVVVGTLLALPGPLSAQAAQVDSAGARAESAAAVVFKGGEVADVGRVLVGGWAGLVFGEHFMLGGEGITLLEEVELPGSESGTGFDLGMGYGGVILKHWWDLPGRLTGEGGLLLGAGHATVKDRRTGREVGSENFPILEPEVGLGLRVFRRVYVGVSVGYRLVWSIEDLPRVSPDDLRSFSGTLSLRVGGR
ncbi:MAG: hypothetical protein PVJ04_02465 [Gemmatimonadota bacterium]